MKRRIDTGSAVLTASAFLIAALVIIQAGGLPQKAAYAEQAAAKGDYSVLTAKSGRGAETDPQELLYVIDGRSEMLMVYEVPDARQNDVQLVGGGSLQNLFIRGRGN